MIQTQRRSDDGPGFGSFELPENGRSAVRLAAGGGSGNDACNVEIDGKTIHTADFRTPEKVGKQQEVRCEHGERLIQYCRDRKLSAGTVTKKARPLKRVLQLAKDRGQLDRHPLRRLKPPEVRVETYW